ncbi:hypothetical protein HDE_06066 [Halotydeus destructor]|nr:hypothetical protein HDE_06066 [Halotydeus destructor]
MSHFRFLPFLALVAICTACPEGWTNVANKKCVKLYPEDVSVVDAAIKCNSYGAEMLKIGGPGEWATIMKLFNMGAYKHIWTRDVSLKFWGQKVGDPCAFNMLEMPANVCPVYTFVAKDNQIKRCTADCGLKYPYACQMDHVAGPGVTEAPETGHSCPAHFTPWGANCYKFLAGRSPYIIECNVHNERAQETNLKIESKAEEEYIRRTMANLGYGAHIKLWMWASCIGKTCEYNDDTKPVNHATLDVDSCANQTGHNIYWDLDSDHWKCPTDLETEEGYYTICKTGGRQIFGAQPVEPTLPSLIAEPTPAPSSSALSLASTFLVLFLVIPQLVNV